MQYIDAYFVPNMPDLVLVAVRLPDLPLVAFWMLDLVLVAVRLPDLPHTQELPVQFMDFQGPYLSCLTK